MGPPEERGMCGLRVSLTMPADTDSIYKNTLSEFNHNTSNTLQVFHNLVSVETVAHRGRIEHVTRRRTKNENELTRGFSHALEYGSRQFLTFMSLLYPSTLRGHGRTEESAGNRKRPSVLFRFRHHGH